MRIDKFGRTFISEEEAMESLYSGHIKNLQGIYLEGDPTQYNSAVLKNADNFPKISEIINQENLSIEEFDNRCQKNWFMPNKYKMLDIENYLRKICPKENYTRLENELELYKKHDMLDLLRYLKYLVDVMKENNIVWGVGRGSSVASYALFLLEVHRIDSVKYDLDIKEFIKEE